MLPEIREKYARQALEAIRATTVFRGQWCGADGIRTNLPTISFGTRETAALYASQPNDRSLAAGRILHPRIWEVRLAVQKPYVLIEQDDEDPFFDLDVIALEFGRDVLRAVARDCSAAIQDTGGYDEIHRETGMYLGEMIEAWPERLDRLPPVLGFRALEVPEFVQALKDAGYDSVCLGGFGENSLEHEWHLFDADLAVDVETGEPVGWACQEEEASLSM